MNGGKGGGGEEIGTDGYGKGEVSASLPVLPSLPNNGDTLAPNLKTGFLSISYPESSEFLVSGWELGDSLGYWSFITAAFLREINASRYGAANQTISFFSSSPESLLATNR